MNKLAIIGVTGLVGQTILKVLEEFQLYPNQLLPVASKNSVGKSVLFHNKKHPIISIEEALKLSPEVTLFSAGGKISKQWAPLFAKNGSIVIDNSSTFRLNDEYPLVVPEINGELLKKKPTIISNPNCSTIQLVMVLAPLEKAYQLKRVVVSTYQAVSGSGRKGITELLTERQGIPIQEKIYPYTIDLNAIPHIDIFEENGYTKEEMKVIQESRKILGLNSLSITSTAVRIPVIGGHSESVNITFKNKFELKDIYSNLKKFPGIIVQDNTTENKYPMPIYVQTKNEVFVGRIRRDYSQANSVNLWIVADPLRKGAATNSIQILQTLLRYRHI